MSNMLNDILKDNVNISNDDIQIIKQEVENMRGIYASKTKPKLIAEIILKLNLDVENKSHICFATQVYNDIINDYHDEIDYVLEKNPLLRDIYRSITES